MRQLLIVVGLTIAALVVIDPTVEAKDITITIQVSAEGDFDATCAAIALGRFRNFTDEQCVTIMIEKAMDKKAHSTANAAGSSAASGVASTSFTDYRARSPEDATLDRQVCGDGIVDTDRGETCDDGNDINRDGCSSCTIDP